MDRKQVDFMPSLMQCKNSSRTGITLILTYGFLFTHDGNFTLNSLRKRNQRHSLGVL